ncbi:hypothetical protein HaLaN_17456 [Haematococcus lacustris]|uniref:Uncharacterized protein n=1 Tax=Haematococcus lacustris TaxID=44745 RepID=A0A699ZPG9_HAELA|nr:hypothetical protein HaLaN_17456 [Haematococcus lacustris]
MQECPSTPQHTYPGSPSFSYGSAVQVFVPRRCVVRAMAQVNRASNVAAMLSCVLRPSVVVTSLRISGQPLVAAIARIMACHITVVVVAAIGQLQHNIEDGSELCAT